MRLYEWFRIDPAACIADTVVALYAALVVYPILGGGSWLAPGLPVDLLLGIAVLVDFFILWKLGILLWQFSRAVEDHGRPRPVPVPLVIAGFVALWITVSLHLPMFFAAFQLQGVPDFTTILLRFFPFGTALVFIGIACGALWGGLEFKRRAGASTLFQRVDALAALVPAGLSLLVMAGTWSLTGSPPAGMLTGAAFAWGSRHFFRFLGRRIEARPCGRVREFRLFYRIVLPALVFMMLCFWTELMVFSRLKGAKAAGETLSQASLALHLVVTGVVPFRLLMACAPPRRPLGVLVALVSLYFFINGYLRLAG